MTTRSTLSAAAFIFCTLQAGCRGAGSMRTDDNRVTTVVIHDEVVRAHTKRVGMNLGGSSFWDSSLVLNNLAYRNPGFEGMLYQSTLRCESGTANSCVDESSSAWPSGFWTGAQYEIFYGTARGRKGTVASSTRIGEKAVLTFSDSGCAPAKGDYLILRQHVSGKAERGWWTNLEGGAQFSTELSDLAPGTPGHQALRLSASGAGQTASIYSYFDSGDRAYIRLQGRYQVSFRAKWLAGTESIQVSVQRGPHTFLNQRVPLAPTWKHYEFAFAAAEPVDIAGTVRLALEAKGSTLLLDDIQFVNVDPDPANKTAFRAPVVHALHEFHPGILRFWVGQLGDSLDNLISPAGARELSGFSAGGIEADQAEVGLHEFLQLCEATGAEPWVVVPIVLSPEEAEHLIEYLAAAASTPYGSRRAARGHPSPWTEAFSQIHLEFGNEAWNETFRGGTILDSKAYGTRADEIFSAMRRSHWFQPGNFDLVLGGQNDWPERNRAIQDACHTNDSFAIAPYQMYNIDSFGSDEELFGPLFAEPEKNVTDGIVERIQQAIQSSRHPVPLSVYEMNLSTFGGSISQQALDRLTPSLGAGLAVADHCLLLSERQGVINQSLWNLGQAGFLRSDGKNARLFGTVVDMGLTDRRRPQFLAVELLNEILGGEMLRTERLGSDPVWRQVKQNGVELQRAHYLQSFAFRQGNQRSLVLFNLHRTQALPVNFGGTLAPAGTVKLKRLSGASPAVNNEQDEQVRISSQQFDGFGSGQTLQLPPASLTVLTWTASANQVKVLSSLRQK